MDLNELDIALFDRLLDGQSTAAEKKALLDRLRADAELKAAFDAHMEVREAFDGHGRKVLKSQFEGLTASIPDTDVKKYRSSAQRGWRNLFRNFLLVSALIAIGYIAFDLLSNKDMEGAAPVTESSEYVLPEKQEAIESSDEVRPTRSTTQQTQRVIVDTVVHTIIVSGDDKEIERMIQDKVDELELADPDAPIIIKKEGLEF